MRSFRLDNFYVRGGGGGGGQPAFFVKLVSEIAIDQQTRTRDQTFDGIPDFNRPPVPEVQRRPYLVKSGSNMPNQLNKPLTRIRLLNSYMENHQDWTIGLSYKPQTICPYLVIRTKFDRFSP